MLNFAPLAILLALSTLLDSPRHLAKVALLMKEIAKGNDALLESGLALYTPTVMAVTVFVGLAIFYFWIKMPKKVL